MTELFSIARAEPVVTAMDISADLSLVELERDPYRFYARLREEAPIVWVPETERLWLTTWEHCKAAGVNERVFGPSQEIHEFVYGRGNILMLAGDEHRTVRASANAAVRPKQVNICRPHIEATASQYIDKIHAQGAADATLDLFEPIIQRVVGDLVGFIDLDDVTLTRWHHTLAAYLVDYGRDARLAERTRAVHGEIRAYLERRLPELAVQPDQTALSHLLHDGMPEGQLRAVGDIEPTLRVLIVGGFQEPAHLVSSALYGLLTHPEQLELVLSDVETWARPAIEEALRWLPPFGMTEKLTTEDVSLGGLLIPAGTEIAMVIGSANRDPQRFERPDDFDIARPNQDNVSFGFGGHFCIGHNVARTAGELLLSQVLRRFRNLRLDSDRRPVIEGWQARAPKSLPIRWDV